MKPTQEFRILLSVTLILWVTLKLAGVLDWSWPIITAPFWVPAALTAVVAMGLALEKAGRSG